MSQNFPDQDATPIFYLMEVRYAVRRGEKIAGEFSFKELISPNSDFQYGEISLKYRMSRVSL